MAQGKNFPNSILPQEAAPVTSLFGVLPEPFYTCILASNASLKGAWRSEEGEDDELTQVKISYPRAEPALPFPSPLVSVIYLTVVYFVFLCIVT